MLRVLPIECPRRQVGISDAGADDGANHDQEQSCRSHESTLAFHESKSEVPCEWEGQASADPPQIHLLRSYTLPNVRHDECGTKDRGSEGVAEAADQLDVLVVLFRIQLTE